MDTRGTGQSGGVSRIALTRRAWLRGGGMVAAAVVGAACAGPAQQSPQAAGPALPEVTVRVHARQGSEDEAYQKSSSRFW